jgi:hypothetical protein
VLQKESRGESSGKHIVGRYSVSYRTTSAMEASITIVQFTRNHKESGGTIGNMEKTKRNARKAMT